MYGALVPSLDPLLPTDQALQLITTLMRQSEMPGYYPGAPSGSASMHEAAARRYEEEAARAEAEAAGGDSASMNAERRDMSAAAV